MIAQMIRATLFSATFFAKATAATIWGRVYNDPLGRRARKTENDFKYSNTVRYAMNQVWGYSG